MKGDYIYMYIIPLPDPILEVKKNKGEYPKGYPPINYFLFLLANISLKAFISSASAYD